MKEIVNPETGLRFLCDNPIEVWRAETLLTKEPGTVAWLRSTVKPGDVVWDVGANIGCYTLLAAAAVGEDGLVWAFEPHVASAAALLRNVAANKFTDRVLLVTAALDHSSGWTPFFYAGKASGRSGSQLRHPRGENGKDFTPSANELKWSLTGDSFRHPGHPERTPSVVKVDVDGRELMILEGIRELLREVRSIQVEVHPADAAGITRELTDACLTFSRRHDTAQGVKLIEGGADPATVTHNAVWERRGA